MTKMERDHPPLAQKLVAYAKKYAMSRIGTAGDELRPLVRGNA